MQVRSLVFALLSSAVAFAGTAMEEATRLYEAKDLKGAEAALHTVVAEDPDNAEACHLLGLVISRSDEPDAYKDGTHWLERAATLAGKNSGYYQDYGETCFFAARAEHSLFYAIRGRNALKRAVEINLDALDSRAMLMEFYARAPWPIGNHKEALDQAAAIASRNPPRGIAGYLLLAQIFEEKGNDDAATKACRAVLKIDPKNAVATDLVIHLETL